MASLERATQILIANKATIIAVNLIIKNMPLLADNYDHPKIIQFIEILLAQNEKASAEILYGLIKEEGDQLLFSNASYLFSTFEFKRNRWKQALEYLSGNIDELPIGNYHTALLIKGISLQRQALHRSAIEAYELIPPSSDEYLATRLNLAISNIRQGWWSEGHTIIEQALSHPEAQKNNEAINRIYLTLGYSLIKQQYFRNARDTFRNITIDSRHTNRALLGIALAAASQEDYSGALSVISTLKEKQSYDLPTDESYLLLPYFYEKLSQSATASAGYFEAITYYQEKIEAIEATIQTSTPHRKELNHTGDTIYISKIPIKTSPDVPKFLIDNYRSLDNYSLHVKKINNKALTIEFELLKEKYEATITKMINTVLEQRIVHLNSYMDQARYGLARLYDSNLERH
ncbi:MAG: hypothetical protein L3J89_11870 [Gammaproteobacteria bacterium]|nr:hypothetical protein [Gammaproteobacteria bacterium]